MALETSVNASTAFRTFAKALRGRDGELAGRTCQIFQEKYGYVELCTYFGLSFPTRFAGDLCLVGSRIETGW
jgi:hypothetical protein